MTYPAVATPPVSAARRPYLTKPQGFFSVVGDGGESGGGGGWSLRRDEEETIGSFGGFAFTLEENRRLFFKTIEKSRDRTIADILDL